MSKTGLLLVNLGTPASPEVADVRRYLGEFLMDPYVIDLPLPLRWLLIHGIILRTRPKKSAHAYQSVWRSEGSPLMVESLNFKNQLSQELANIPVELAMRYGEPSVSAALSHFTAAGVTDLVVWPLYPQYAESSYRTAEEHVKREVARLVPQLGVQFMPPFYDEPSYQQALVDVARESLSAGVDHLLVTFHGLPKRHITKVGNCRSHCQFRNECCNKIVESNRRCYRAHCLHTARTIAHGLGLNESQWTMSFQSRLGPGWIEPFTDLVITDLAKRGVKRLGVVSPAFVSDCLETLEELGIRGRELFMEAGGREYILVPSLNSHPSWIRAAATIAHLYLK